MAKAVAAPTPIKTNNSTSSKNENASLKMRCLKQKKTKRGKNRREKLIKWKFAHKQTIHVSFDMKIIANVALVACRLQPFCYLLALHSTVHTTHTHRDGFLRKYIYNFLFFSLSFVSFSEFNRLFQASCLCIYVWVTSIEKFT